MAQQERAVRTRRSILEAAAAVFDERGYHSATIGEILTRAGVTKGALYFHFASKEELALGVLDARLTYLATPPRDRRLQEVVDSGMVLAHRLRHDPLVRAGLSLALDQGARGVDRSAPFRVWTDQYAELLRAAREQGELLPHVSLTETAELLTGCFTGLQVMSQILDGRRDLGGRLSVLLHHVMPSVAVPAVLVGLDMAPDRGERVFAEITEIAGAAARWRPPAQAGPSGQADSVS